MAEDIGKIIIRYCHEHNIPVTAVAKKLGYERTAFYRLLRRHDMYISVLFDISQFIEHNFFQYLWVDKTMLTKEAAAKLRRENYALKKQVEQLTRENSLLHKLVPK